MIRLLAIRLIFIIGFAFGMVSTGAGSMSLSGLQISTPKPPKLGKKRRLEIEANITLSKAP